MSMMRMAMITEAAKKIKTVRKNRQGFLFMSAAGQR